MDQRLRAELLRRSTRDQQARQQWLDEGEGWAEVKRIEAEDKLNEVLIGAAAVTCSG